MKKSRIGLTIMKAMPFHKGHEFLIAFGSKMLDELHVLVSGKENDIIPLEVRFNWVVKYSKQLKMMYNTKVYVYIHIDASPDPINVDEHGTVLDKPFQDYWVSEFKSIVPKANVFVSSDRYGQTMAELMNIDWLPVDPDREIFPFSATMIRNDINKNFHLLSDIAMPYFVKTVTVIGPESTGKSTMAKKLAEKFNGAYLLEYGRTISEMKKNDLTEDDFLNIVHGQKHLVNYAIKYSNKRLIVSDTDAFTTGLFAEMYDYHDIAAYCKTVATDQRFMLYLLLAPTVDWINDGTRIAGTQEVRDAFYEHLLGFLKDNNMNYIIIDEPDFALRMSKAYASVEDMLNQSL